jgi:sortase A
MRKRMGVLCILLGVACLLSSVGFIAYNRWEDKTAAATAQSLLEDVQSLIHEKQPEQPLPNDTEIFPAEMATVAVGNYDCIGILSVPVLDLELPVLSEWSYAKLKKAPCHYYGTCYEENFVIAAHNYKSHFGRLSELQAGDLIVFTDAHGVDHHYEVVLLETLPKEATKEMIAGGFDLSLYTCTTGGTGRVTVRCRAVANGRP